MAPASPVGPPEGRSLYGHGGGSLGAQVFETAEWRACLEVLNQSTMAVEDKDRPATLVIVNDAGEEIARAHIERSANPKTRRACASPGAAGNFELQLNAPWTSTWRVKLGP
jgi:hypothetical protein